MLSSFFFFLFFFFFFSVIFFGRGGGGGSGGNTETKSHVKTHFFWQKKCMYNRVIVWMWTAWCTRLKYSQNVEITEETTDFENCTRGQAETRNASFLDVEHKTIPYWASSVHFASGHFYPFRKLPVWVQTFETWITRYPWEKKKNKKKKYPQNCFEAHQFMVQMH